MAGIATKQRLLNQMTPKRAKRLTFKGLRQALRPVNIFKLIRK